VSAVLTKAQARKKNLIQGSTYHFSVKPVMSTADEDMNVMSVWSPQSAGMQPCPPAAVLSPAFSRTLPPALLSNATGTSAASGLIQTPVAALAGKAIAIYFSASWCGPCRRY
jgi:thiol-disulfide isomerase/thioredoxin